MILKKSDNNFMIGAAIFVVIILLISGLYFVYGTSEIDTIDDSDDEQITIDDQISPESNQALLVDINRIRHRGSVDAMLSRGTGWKNPPTYYYIVTRDGNEFISKDVAAAGGAAGTNYINAWDTFLEENRIQEDIEEEQEFVDVKIEIVEVVPTGILGRKTTDEIKETIVLEYNFRTGRWTGDDFLMDDDGYGHYLGDTFEVWFQIYQTDYDADYIPYWTEVNLLGTNPKEPDTNKDPDGDGIPTTWEWYWGYDPFTWDDHENLDPDVDGLQNIEEYEMSKYYANPFRPDIYIEVDGMVDNGLFDIPHVWYEESSQIVIERFASHGINVYIDNGWKIDTSIGGGEMLKHVDVISQETGLMLQWYLHRFSDARKGIFRYMVVGHEAGFAIPSEFNRYDTIVIDSSPMRLLRRTAFTPRTQRIVLASAAMHELGHTLGIAPWTFQGCDNLSFAYGRAAKQEYIDTWADYESVMNYYHIWDKTIVDYSDGSNGPPYDQDDWANFYLPFFEIDANAVEDPMIEPPGTDRIIDEPPEPVWKGWVYEENLTKDYEAMLKEKCYVENVDTIEIRVYVPEDQEDMMNATVKVYARPIMETTYSQWSLIADGMLTEDNEIMFYSQEAELDKLMDLI